MIFLFYKHVIFGVLPPHRELQFLADQERISPAAIKKTTLDKVLQQPGVSVSDSGNGNNKSGLNLFNNRSSGLKKKNWEQKEPRRQTRYRFRCANVHTSPNGWSTKKIRLLYISVFSLHEYQTELVVLFTTLLTSRTMATGLLSTWNTGPETSGLLNWNDTVAIIWFWYAADGWCDIKL